MEEEDIKPDVSNLDASTSLTNMKFNTDGVVKTESDNIDIKNEDFEYGYQCSGSAPSDEKIELSNIEDCKDGISSPNHKRDKKFRQKDHVTRKSDIKSHHNVHTPGKPLKIPIFNKTKNALKTHRMVQSGQKPYNCEECGKACSGKSKLNRHKMVHTGGKPFSCEECGKAFSGKSNLNRHKMVHTGEKPFSCEECGKSFYLSYALNRHK